MTQSSSENPSLLTALERCGHFLHHRRGGKHSQARILRILYDQENTASSGLSQLRLQQMLGIRSGSISEIIGKMEASGLIRKTRQPDDRRKICLALTDTGRKAYLQARQEQEQLDATLFYGLTNEEQEQLLILLQKLFQSWQDQFGPELFSEHRKNTSGGTPC